MKKRKQQKRQTEIQHRPQDALAGPTKLIGELKSQIAHINSKISKIEEKLLIEKNKDHRQKLMFEKNSLIRDENFKATDLRRQEVLVTQVKEEIERKKKFQQIEKQIEKRGRIREQERNNVMQSPPKTNNSKSVVKDPPLPAQEAYTERQIEWKHVRFLDGAIFFEISPSHFSAHYKCPISRQSFNYLKKYFVYKKMLPLKVRFKNQVPVEVINIEELQTVLEILQIENYIYFENSGNDQNRPRISKMGLDKNSICKIYQLYSKSRFFDHLIKLHDDKFKVIPIPEVILDESGRIIRAEDSFIFSFAKNNMLFLIWESVIEKKATYIFRSTISSYETSIQKLFDYISSPEIKNKRETLIYNYQPKKYLDFSSRILHTIPSEWINSLKQI